MTDTEKIVRIKGLISPDTADDELLVFLLEQSEGIVLNRRYPFGVPENTVVPAMYEHIQIQIAVELYSKMGAEGQTQHDENGIKRVFEAADVSPALLRKILPMVGSVS
jgi:hypothetical protein